MGLCGRLLALLLLVAPVVWPPTASAQNPTAERPTYAVGDKWIRDDGVWDMVRIENDAYVFAAEGKREIRLTKDLGFAEGRERNVIEWELSPAAPLVWPLEVGKWGRNPLQRPMYVGGVGGGVANLLLLWQVEAYEDVRVPAGVFKAFRIAQSVISAGSVAGPPTPYRIVAWYAPSVRQYVKAEGTLKGFKSFEVVAVDQPEPRVTIARDGRPAAVAARPATPAAPPATVAPSSRPLTIAISSPVDAARVSQDSIALAALVTSGKAVRRVTVTVNDVEVSRQEQPGPASAVNVALKLQEGTNTIVVSATDADGATQKAVRTVVFAPPTPLAVALTYPADGAKLAQSASVVAGTIRSSKGVGRVSVLLNGAEVHQETQKSPTKALALSVPLTLRDGPNVIVVAATDSDGDVRQEVRIVFLDRPTLAAAPSPAAPPPPRPIPDRWAVIVGIGAYESGDVNRLRYSVADAEAMYQTLTGPGGFRKEHVLLLTDRSERKPTLRNIRWALGTFLSRSAKKDDTVLIYFAGHGAPEADPRGLERDGLAKYLIPADADPDDLYSSALPMDELHTIFGRIEAERVVVLLDACYSGAAGGRTFSSKRTRASHLDELFLERLTASRGRVIVTASRPSEVSIELPELGHGLFTYYLLQGLRGAADANRDGIVTIQELYEYVEQQVSAKSRAVGGNQHPVMKGELEGALPLVKLSR